MRDPLEVERFTAEIEAKSARRLEGGADEKKILAKTRHYCRCYEACIPREFWSVSSKSVKRNKGIFDHRIRRYLKHWQIAARKGYGLLLTGDNGTGKTMFVSWLLVQLAKRGVDVYYTTVPRLDQDFQRGFRDLEWERQLRMRLRRPFVAIDELGKGAMKAESYLPGRIELVLKDRCDDALPTLCATNLSPGDLEEAYGSTVSSMFNGKYETLMMESGDFRQARATKMRKEMGFDDG